MTISHNKFAVSLSRHRNGPAAVNKYASNGEQHSFDLLLHCSYKY